MRFFTRMSPTRAVRDLRAFLALRKPHELYFLVAAMAITLFLVWAIAHDSAYRGVYKPNIIYVQQWRLDRTEGEILAQQKVDQAAREKREAEVKKANDAQRAGFKKMDDGLKAWGL